MNQHPSVTIAWAASRLEAAIAKLDDGVAERRVRSQFHQLLLALERGGHPGDPRRHFEEASTTFLLAASSHPGFDSHIS
jgi:hypothetical protein